MTKITYHVDIPEVLVEHTDDVRGNIEVLVKLHFAGWAMASLVDQIKISKPRGQGKNKKETPPDPPAKKQAPSPAANLGV